MIPWIVSSGGSRTKAILLVSSPSQVNSTPSRYHFCLHYVRRAPPIVLRLTSRLHTRPPNINAAIVIGSCSTVTKGLHPSQLPCLSQSDPWVLSNITTAHYTPAHYTPARLAGSPPPKVPELKVHIRRERVERPTRRARAAVSFFSRSSAAS